VEVMGRNCGYLAVMAALTTASDYVIIPEVPLPTNWRDTINDRIDRIRRNRKRFVIVVAEGARDEENNLITANDVKEALSIKSRDVRTTILGHVQRGGSPTAIDRIISVLLSDKAVNRAFELAEMCRQTNPDSTPEAEVAVWRKGTCELVLLKEAVAACRAVQRALDNKDFVAALNLRGDTYKQVFKIYCTLQRPFEDIPQQHRQSLRIAVMHIGGVSPGMNDSLRSCVRWGVSRGHQMFGVRNGFTGLVAGDLKPLDYQCVDHICGWAGAWLGTRRSFRAQDFSSVSRVIEEHRIDGLVMIGGWDGYLCMIAINDNRSIYKGFRNLRLVCVPCSISNNLPCTQWSVGSDTSLNIVTNCVDMLRASAAASTRVFFVDILGTTGYQAVFGGMAGGVEGLQILEEAPSLESLSQDLKVIKNSFKRGKEKAVILHSESLSLQSVFTLQFLKGLFEQNSSGLFDVRTVELGHLQNGGSPTPQDRLLGTMMGTESIHALEKTGPCKIYCVGWQENRVVISSGPEMQIYMDHEHQAVYDPWWVQYRALAVRINLEQTNI